MHFYNLIKELSKKNKIKLFVDMDGVIASYDFGKPLNFKIKRPLKTNIEVLRKVASLENVEMFILSVCRKNYQIDEKNMWLDKNAPFFERNNRCILSKEETQDASSANLKLQFLKNYIIKENEKIVFVDDDNKVLSTVAKELHNIILLQDSELID